MQFLDYSLFGNTVYSYFIAILTLLVTFVIFMLANRSIKKNDIFLG